jgi:hypothetical protein
MISTRRSTRFSTLRSVRARITAAALLCQVILGIGFLAAATCALGDEPSNSMPVYQFNHDYVHYSPEGIPSSQGTIVDVTNSVTGQDGHVYDGYGNELIINRTDGSIKDVNGVTVGFIYSTGG